MVDIPDFDVIPWAGRKELWVGALAAEALLFVLIASFHILREPLDGLSPASLLLGFIPPIFAVVSILASVCYLMWGEVETLFARRVALWTLVGASFAGAVAVLVLVHWHVFGADVVGTPGATFAVMNVASGGAILGLLTGMLDVERAEQSERFNQSEQKYRLLVETSTDAIVSCREDQVIDHWNQAASEIFGYEKDEVIGKEIDDILVPEEYLEDHVNGFENYLETGEGHLIGRTVEMEALHRDGTVFPVEISLSDAALKDGHLFTAIIRDIRERKHVEAELSVFDRLLRHNLRNQINVILGESQLIEEEVNNLDVKRRLQRVENAATRLVEHSKKARLAREISRNNAPVSPVDAVELVRQQIRVERRNFPDAEIHLRAPESAPVMGSDALRYVVAELVQNAVLHSDRERPTVEVSISPSERMPGYVDIEVADDGPGIPRGERCILFEDGETPLKHSAGIGLWLVKWFSDLQRGDLSFSKNNSRGSVVTLSLRAA